MYFPLSQITTNLTTQGGEFQIQATGEDYVGSYFKTSKNQFYTGKVPNDGVNLLLIEATTSNEANQQDVEQGLIGSYNDEADLVLLPNQYIRANPKSSSVVKNAPKTSLTRPTAKQYENTKYKRYFIKRTTNFIYKEVDLKTYRLYINQDPTVQFSLYNAISIDWYIAGNLLDVYRKNLKIVGLAEEQNKWFGFVQYFKDRFARFYKKLPNATYYTKGGELKIKGTNIEYIGFYHVHPSRGVLMEGQVHVNTPHNVLVLIEEGDILTKVQKASEEVGTSRRTNFPSRGGGGY